MKATSQLELNLQGLGKRFVNDWIFRNVGLNIKPGQPCAITGPNGSGKSTLLQIIAGFMQPAEGQVQYWLNGNGISVELVFQYISIATPYMELLEEFTLAELLSFHLKFKKFQTGTDATNFAERARLSKIKGKPIRQYSSGMKQRVKLGLALYEQTPLLLLDEPCANLDAAGAEWYKSEILGQIANRTVIIGSNVPFEYDFCEQIIAMTDYKIKNSGK